MSFSISLYQCYANLTHQYEVVNTVTQFKEKVTFKTQMPSQPNPLELTSNFPSCAHASDHLCPVSSTILMQIWLFYFKWKFEIFHVLDLTRVTIL